MSRPRLLVPGVSIVLLAIGCAHCDTCDDFPAPCTGPNCGYPYQHLGPYHTGAPIMGGPIMDGGMMGTPIISSPMEGPESVDQPSLGNNEMGSTEGSNEPETNGGNTGNLPSPPSADPFSSETSEPRDPVLELPPFRGDQVGTPGNL